MRDADARVAATTIDRPFSFHTITLAKMGRMASEAPQLSIVMPCLNEAETLGACIRKAHEGFTVAGIRGEVIVADNGSTDGSQQIATDLGARLVPVKARGYGNALMGGIEAAESPWIIMGDADDSYDFREVPKFVDKLKEGHDLVQGCRLPSGGGRIMPGAMPLLHRWWGNPMFSRLARWWFKAPIHDVYCGMRGFTKSHYEQLQLRCVGMEFATEMIIKSSLSGSKIAEVPITLHKDGRTKHAPHLKTFRDGWRTLRFFLMFSPRWLFLVPGLFLILIGLAVSAWLLPGPRTVGQVTFDVHTLLCAAAAIIIGYHSVMFAVFTKVFAIGSGLMPEDARLTRVFSYVTLETGLIVGAAMIIVGLVALLIAIAFWKAQSFGPLDYPRTLRVVIPAVTLTSLGFQTVLSSFFLSVLGMKRR